MAERTHHFERLKPIDNMDLTVYEEAIDYAFDNSDIKNDIPYFKQYYLLRWNCGEQRTCTKIPVADFKQRT